jgi:hypothetical protein
MSSVRAGRETPIWCRFDNDMKGFSFVGGAGREDSRSVNVIEGGSMPGMGRGPFVDPAKASQVSVYTNNLSSDGQTQQRGPGDIGIRKPGWQIEGPP